eukprot:scaffold5966_cov118-Cylindrotheca_fusiformis.AAC.20
MAFADGTDPCTPAPLLIDTLGVGINTVLESNLVSSKNSTFVVRRNMGVSCDGVMSGLLRWILCLDRNCNSTSRRRY